MAQSSPIPKRTRPAGNDPAMARKRAIKANSPEAIFLCFAMATGYQELQNPQNGRVVFINGLQGPRAEFLQRFATQDKKTETQTSILQALSMMNGKFVADATSIDLSEQAILRTSWPAMRDALSRHLSAISQKKPKKP